MCDWLCDMMTERDSIPLSDLNFTLTQRSLPKKISPLPTQEHKTSANTALVSTTKPPTSVHTHILTHSTPDVTCSNLCIPRCDYRVTKSSRSGPHEGPGTGYWLTSDRTRRKVPITYLKPGPDEDGRKANAGQIARRR